MEKKWLFLLLIVVAGFFGFYFYRKYQVPPPVNFNTIGLVDMAGKPVNFSQLKGTKTVLCFGASWCGNCLTELKDINSVKQEDMKDVNIVVISDEPFEKVQAFASHTGYPFLFLKMDRSFPAIGINSIPVSYLLNASQRVVKQETGYINWKDPSTREHLKKLMEES